MSAARKLHVSESEEDRAKWRDVMGGDTGPKSVATSRLVGASEEARGAWVRCLQQVDDNKTKFVDAAPPTAAPYWRAVLGGGTGSESVATSWLCASAEARGAWRARLQQVDDNKTKFVDAAPPTEAPYWRAVLGGGTGSESVATSWLCASAEARGAWRARLQQVDDSKTKVAPLSEIGLDDNPIMCGSVNSAISLHKNGEEEEAEGIAASPPLEVEEVGPPPPADDSEEGEYYSCSYTSMMASGRRGRSFLRLSGEGSHRGVLDKEETAAGAAATAH
jgi:hypothetical protein